MKPARKAISTLWGEGTWATTRGREQVGGQGPGRLQTILPWFPGAPDLACTNEATPRGESHTAIRPRYRRPSGRDTDGHPAETPTDKLAHKGGLQGDVTHTSPIQYRTGREGGTLVYSPPAGPGHRSWARKPGTREKQTDKNILASLCFRTFRYQ